MSLRSVYLIRSKSIIIQNAIENISVRFIVTKCAKISSKWPNVKSL